MKSLWSVRRNLEYPDGTYGVMHQEVEELFETDDKELAYQVAAKVKPFREDDIRFSPGYVQAVGLIESAEEAWALARAQGWINQEG